MNDHRFRTFALLAFVLLFVSAACSGRRTALSIEWREDRSTEGGVTTVRTLSGSKWGGTARLVEKVSIGSADGTDEDYMLGVVRGVSVSRGHIYVLDGQAYAVKVYTLEGVHVRSFGREGSGPGEFRRPESMDIRASDGYVFVRDGQGGRISIFTPEGEYATQWPIHSGWQYSDEVFFGTDGVLYSPSIMDQNVPVPEWTFGYVGVGPEGATGDTLWPPRVQFEEARLVAHGESGGTSLYSVPFSADVAWEFSRRGEAVGGLNERYRIEVRRRDGSRLVIERDFVPVAVAANEAAWHQKAMHARMESAQPGWAWNGPPIPRVKPAWDGVLTDEDGRIWVRRQGPGIHQVDCIEDPKPQDRWWNSPCWVDSYVIEVFSPEGSFLGEVEAPPTFDLTPRPWIQGDTVVAVVSDEIGNPYVKRYHMVTPTGDGRGAGGS